jgi:glycosyltransferase involved in cell wall biosynthesis
LALKLNTVALAETTFPSKVIEYAAAGMLVLTTDISDVRQVLGDGALYLQQDNALQLVSLFERVVQDRIGSQSMAALGCERVRAQCSPASAGRLVSDFLAGAR